MNTFPPYQTYIRMEILRWSDRQGLGKGTDVAIGGVECDTEHTIGI